MCNFNVWHKFWHEVKTETEGTDKFTLLIQAAGICLSITIPTFHVFADVCVAK